MVSKSKIIIFTKWFPLVISIFYSCSQDTDFLSYSNEADSLPIHENQEQNQVPVAHIETSTNKGTAPLTVIFDGSKSSDDSSLKSFTWYFDDGATSQEAMPSHTFNTPGHYDVTLTVLDDAGLTDEQSVSIVVDPPENSETPTQEEPLSGEVCSTQGGRADDVGLKTWCWEEIEVPAFSGSGADFSNKQLRLASQCVPNQITKAGHELRFHVNPTAPNPQGWCENDFNMRAEIRMNPWHVKHPLGTEEWFGWSYRFGDNYKIDQNNQWLFFQVHNGIMGMSPHVELMVSNKNQIHGAGEIFIVNKGNYPDIHSTGVIPEAGDVLHVVVHAIWDHASNGLLQVWINGTSVYDKQVATVYGSHPWGGNAKWGIYKWPWRNVDRVQQSIDSGTDNLETFMGPLRVITRKPSDPNYGKDAYSLVDPNQ